MAKDDDQDTPAKSPAAEAQKKKGGVVVALVIAVVLSVGASAGVSWYLIHNAVSQIKSDAATEGEGAEGEAKPEVPAEPANYVALDPAFVVNLEDEQSSRFLQVQIEVMTRNAHAVEQITRHAPRIRSALLLLLGQQKAAALQTREGKEALQAQVLAEIQNILKAETGETEVEAVYFTSFVIQ